MMSGPTKIRSAATSLEKQVAKFVAAQYDLAVGADRSAPGSLFPPYAGKTLPTGDPAPRETRSSAVGDTASSKAGERGSSRNADRLPAPSQPVDDTSNPEIAPDELYPRLIVAVAAATLAICTFLWVLPPPWLGPAPLSATVVQVQDGDKLQVSYSGQSHQQIRLAQIDAPQLGQPGGGAARSRMQQLVLGREVQVYIVAPNHLEATIVRLRINGADVSRQMVADGQAVAYGDVLDDPLMPVLEWRARLLGIGLWGQTHSQKVSPQLYRRNHINNEEEIVEPKK